MKLKTLHLSTITLLKGSHNPDSQFCVMELASFIAGEKWSDRPDCASPVITAFLVVWNDGLNDEDRQMLKPYAVKIIGTRTTAADEITRAWMATDWLVRTCAPAWLRLTPELVTHADTLARLSALTDRISADKAGPALSAAAEAAWAARAAGTAEAAWAAAEKALAPTVKELQKSALDLLDRMIAVGRHDVPLAVRVK